MSEYTVIGMVVAAFIAAGVLSYLFTPPVKRFAQKIGAIDVPKDNRRMHKQPIPRLGGLAIFGGFLCSILVFGQLDQTMLCVLLGASIIVALGIFDDVLALGAKLKFVVQIVAAAIRFVWVTCRSRYLPISILSRMRRIFIWAFSRSL